MNVEVTLCALQGIHILLVHNVMVKAILQQIRIHKFGNIPSIIEQI